MVKINDSIMLMQRTLNVGTTEDQKVFNILSEKIRYNAELTLLKSIISQNRDIAAAQDIINKKIKELESEIAELRRHPEYFEELAEKEHFLKVLKEQRDFLLSNNYVGYVWNIGNNAEVQSLIDECAMELKYRYSKIATLFGENLVEEVYEKGSKVPHFKVKTEVVEFIFSLVTNSKLMNNLRVLNAIDQKVKMSEADIKQIQSFIDTLYLIVDSEEDYLAKYFEHLKEYEAYKREMSDIRNQWKQIKSQVGKYEERLFTSLTNSSKLKQMHHRLEFLKEKYEYLKTLKKNEEDIIFDLIGRMQDEGLKTIFTTHFELAKSKLTGKSIGIDKLKTSMVGSLTSEDDFYELIAKHLDELDLDGVLALIDTLKEESKRIEQDRDLTLKEASKYKKFLNKKIMDLARMDYKSCTNILDIFDKKYELGLSPIMIITVLMICDRLKELKYSDLDEIMKKEDQDSLKIHFKGIIAKKAKHDLDITTSLIESKGKESMDSALSLI